MPDATKGPEAKRPKREGSFHVLVHLGDGQNRKLSSAPVLAKSKREAIERVFATLAEDEKTGEFWAIKAGEYNPTKPKEKTEITFD